VLAPLAVGQSGDHDVQVRNVASAGVHENRLAGYGLVIGLAGTGDRRKTTFSSQMLDNIVLKLGATIPAAAVRGQNVAAVFVTASLPPLARPGARIDVTVSPLGDATRLEGGTLLLAPLYAADGQVYAEAQGPVTFGRSGSAPARNQVVTGRILKVGLVEREYPAGPTSREGGIQ
jgi:flagellar P-ring protein precursor FlgI